MEWARRLTFLGGGEVFDVSHGEERKRERERWRKEDKRCGKRLVFAFSFFFSPPSFLFDMKVVVVGGGIAGVSCTEHLLRHLHDESHPSDLEITLVSASDFLKVCPSRSSPSSPS